MNMISKWNSLNILFKNSKLLYHVEFRTFKHASEMNELFLKQEGTKTHGDLHIVPLTSKYISGTWNLLNDVFFKEEPTCKYLRLSDNIEAKAELKPIFTWIMDEGISMVVTNKKTDEVVAANINKIWVPESYEFLKQCKQKCVHSVSKAYLQEITDVDIFKICSVKNIFEIFVGASSICTRGTGLTREMFSLSVRFSNYLSKKKEKKNEIYEINYPEAVISVLASTSTRGEQLGLRQSVEIDLTVKYEDNEMIFRNKLAYSHLPMSNMN